MSGDYPKSLTLENAALSRADSFVQKEFPHASRSALQKLFAEKQVRINGATAKKGDTVRQGDCVTLLSGPATETVFEPAPNPALRLNVLFEDRWLVAVNKPPLTHCHPLLPEETDTVANFLAAAFPECAGASEVPREGGLVHRLDRDTTGVVIAARNQSTWKKMRSLFSKGLVEKTYLALVTGHPGRGESSKPILQTGSKSKINSNGLEAHTTWDVLATARGHTLLRCVSKFGRRHQIRLHLAHAGFPIVGDSSYGGASLEIAPGESYFLHGETVGFAHPETGAATRYFAPLSPTQLDVLQELGLSLEGSELDLHK